MNTIRFLIIVALTVASTLAPSRCASLRAATSHSSRKQKVESLCGDLWLVSTRGLACPYGQNRSCAHATYSRWNGRSFVHSSRAEYLATLPATTHTSVFIHGNRKTAESAQEQGLDVYREISCANPAMRFIIWSWPSDRVPGLLRDARVKADRADAESFYLGSFLADHPGDMDVSIVAFSFGARTAMGALHLLAGGTLCGNQLAIDPSSTVHPRVALLAAALPRQWLLPHGAHGLALAQSKEVISYYNRRDPLLKHFDLVSKSGKPEALGFQGINAGQCGAPGMVLRQYDASRSVGHTHSLSRYLDSPGIMNTIRQRIVTPAITIADHAVVPASL